tara:strand:+ start:1259 stop:2053 length:795 start_codon:yes stop_codon:yes gene_type:complete
VSGTDGSEDSFPDGQYRFPQPGRLEEDWRKWGFGQVIIGYALSLVASIVTLSLILELAGYGDWDELPMWGVSLVGLSQQLVLIIAVVVSARAFGFSLQKDFLLQSKKSDLGKGLCYGIAAQILVVPVVTYPFVWIFDIDADRISEPARELSDKATSPLGIIAIIFTVGLLAPVAEELFFRGLLYGSIRKRGDSARSQKVIVWTSVIVSSAIFSAIHFQLLLFPALFVVGMIFAIIYERSQRLALAIWAHVGFNATTLLSLLVLD